MGVLDHRGITHDDLDIVLSARTSVRGAFIGLLAQYKLQSVFSDPRIDKLVLHDGQGSSRPGDFSLEFEGEIVTVEVKSLQPCSVGVDNGRFTGRCHVRARERRMVRLPGGSELQTSCFVVGEFDLLAVNLFEFGQRWRFGFIRNRDLPRTRYNAYRTSQRKHLLATSVAVSWPLEPPFQDQPFDILRDIVRERLHRH